MKTNDNTNKMIKLIENLINMTKTAEEKQRPFRFAKVGNGEMKICLN